MMIDVALAGMAHECRNGRQFDDLAQLISVVNHLDVDARDLKSTLADRLDQPLSLETGDHLPGSRPATYRSAPPVHAG